MLFKVTDLQFNNYALRLMHALSAAQTAREILSLLDSIHHLERQVTDSSRMETYDYIMYKHDYLLSKFMGVKCD